MKLKFTLLLILFLNFAQAAVIENITISRISEQEINIHVGTRFPYCYGYNSYQYNVTGNTITLQICYDQFLCSEYTQQQNDFQIPLNNVSPENYTLIVNTYFSTIEGCDYSFLIDSKTVSFSTPVNTTIVLLSKLKYDYNNLSIFPNPTTGVLEVRNNNSIDNINIYDNSSRLVKVMQNTNQNIDLTELADGMYFIELKNDTERFIKKVVLRK